MPLLAAASTKAACLKVLLVPFSAPRLHNKNSFSTGLPGHKQIQRKQLIFCFSHIIKHSHLQKEKKSLVIFVWSSAFQTDTNTVIQCKKHFLEKQSTNWTLWFYFGHRCSSQHNARNAVAAMRAKPQALAKISKMFGIYCSEYAPVKKANSFWATENIS